MSNSNKKKSQDYFVIDFAHIFKTLWKKLWIIVLTAVICGTLAFGYAYFIITPQYAAGIMLYVNNSSISLGNSFSISSSELTAAQSLVKTYSVILKNRTTIEEVIANSAYKDLKFEDVNHMITTQAVDDTEVLEVIVTCDDYKMAANIANTIKDVLPRTIKSIIIGSEVTVVDSAVENSQKVSPHITGYTEIGLLLGAVLATIFVVISAMLDDTIHDEEYINKNYEYPILAVIPNLTGASDKQQYAYYYKRRKTGSK